MNGATWIILWSKSGKVNAEGPFVTPELAACRLADICMNVPTDNMADWYAVAPLSPPPKFKGRTA